MLTIHSGTPEQPIGEATTRRIHFQLCSPKRRFFHNALWECRPQFTDVLLASASLITSIASYASPIWSTNTSDSNFEKIRTVQNADLRTATGDNKIYPYLPSLPGVPHAESEGPLRHALCAVVHWRMTTYVMTSQLNSRDP